MIKLVVTDLDNTVYDWVAFFVPGFNAMVAELSKLSSVEQQVLRESFKRVHRRHGTTEYPFSIMELDVLPEVVSGRTSWEILNRYGSAVKAFFRVGKRNLRLYPGAKRALAKIRSAGRKLVAHTDASMSNAIHRLGSLGVIDKFDGVVALRDYVRPDGFRVSDVFRFVNGTPLQFSVPYTREVETEEAKPNRRALTDLLEYHEVTPREAIYVGDSLRKDVALAQACGMHDAYAAYGRNSNPDYYRQLVEVTHWSDDDVASYKDPNKPAVRPTFTISRFDEVTRVIDFIEARRTEAKYPLR